MLLLTDRSIALLGLWMGRHCGGVVGVVVAVDVTTPEPSLLVLVSSFVFNPKSNLIKYISPSKVYLLFDLEYCHRRSCCDNFVCWYTTTYLRTVAEALPTPF